MMPATLPEIRAQLDGAARRALTTVDAMVETFGPRHERTLAAVLIAGNLEVALAGVERAIAAGQVAA